MSPRKEKKAPRVRGRRGGRKVQAVLKRATLKRGPSSEFRKGENALFLSTESEGTFPESARNPIWERSKLVNLVEGSYGSHGGKPMKTAHRGTRGTWSVTVKKC